MGEGKQGQAGGGEGGGPHACDVGLSPLLTVHGRAGHRRHLWVPPVDHSQLGEGHKANGSEEAAACRGASAGAPRALLWSDPQPPPTHTHARKREGPCPLPTQELCSGSLFQAARLVTSSKRYLSGEHHTFKNGVKQKPLQERCRRWRDGSVHARSRKGRLWV